MVPFQTPPTAPPPPIPPPLSSTAPSALESYVPLPLPQLLMMSYPRGYITCWRAPKSCRRRTEGDEGRQGMQKEYMTSWERMEEMDQPMRYPSPPSQPQPSQQSSKWLNPCTQRTPHCKETAISLDTDDHFVVVAVVVAVFIVNITSKTRNLALKNYAFVSLQLFSLMPQTPATH